MDFTDKIRRIKRVLESYMSFASYHPRLSFKRSRRALLFLMIIFGFILYVGPSLFRWLRHKTPIMIDPGIGCVAVGVDPYLQDVNNFDANLHRTYETEDKFLLPFVGNGKIGLPIKEDNPVYIFHNRSSSLPLPFHPIVTVNFPGASSQEAFVVHYTKGTVYRFQCYTQRRRTVSINQHFYAHRTIPSLLFQHIKIVNPLVEPITVYLDQKGSLNENLQSKPLNIKDNNNQEYILWLGRMSIPGSSDLHIAFSLITTRLQKTLTVEPKSSSTLQVLTFVHYSDPITLDQFPATRSIIEQQIKMDFEKALSLERHVLKNIHIEAWKQLWSSGFRISYSKAQGSLNGDKINATMYYVLSNIRSFSSEWNVDSAKQHKIQSLLAFPERCYGGHHTLQASTLWTDLSSLSGVNQVVSLWLLTLEKQGCQNLVMAGAEGVMQAMLLSFGQLLFKNNHLEFNTHPKDLHRDYFFRRLSYGNSTHVNISVVLGEDNKALLYVALDRSDKDYYACDGGCLDLPVKLDSKPKQFPVKLTDPVTAILYITADEPHMKVLKHTIHVKEVAEAPAHEHHIIALHRHGHQLGGLPALFWVSIAFLIVVFHLFLVKLIYNEYCGAQEKARGRYVV